jgi:formylglycine-generating enzyme required for sulfatase activity
MAHLALESDWEGSQAGDRKVVQVNDQDVAFRWCPATPSFRMGSPPGDKQRSYDEDAVNVTLTHGSWMQETEVTQGLWKAVMGTALNWPPNVRSPDLPAFNMSHGEAEAFAAALAGMVDLPPDMTIVLPPEAQWEYAARAGTTTRYPFGNQATPLREYAWFRANSGGVVHEVATRLANAWGLHDMLGNVWEWCADGHSQQLPGGVDPCQPGTTERIIRGASCAHPPRACRPAARGVAQADSRANIVGFRVAVATNTRVNSIDK